jgi:hypothetical protein
MTTSFSHDGAPVADEALPLSLSGTRAEGAQGLGLRVDVHDASRLEWVVAVPLPEEESRSYALVVQLEIPANVFAPHAAWAQLQSWTRLDGPIGRPYPHDDVTIDNLRRSAISTAQRLTVAHDGFVRHCRLAAALMASTPLDDLLDKLDLWLGVGTATVSEARAKLVATRTEDTPEVRHERNLVDEYISVRYLDALAGVQQALEVLRDSRHAERHADVIASATSHLAEALAAELGYRRDRGYVCGDDASPAALQEYLERTSRLKKHFQEVLFLESSTYQVADRIHHWVAAVVALFASTWAFAWQLALLNRKPTTGSQLGSGLILVATIAGVVYATKDRIKEIGKSWISGNVHRLYAQRVARWFTPAKRFKKRQVVAKARESFDQFVSTHPDPLNPAAHATTLSTVIRYTHRGTVMAQPAVLASGARGIRHVFRYDLSPLFARLDDTAKRVPVLDPVTRKVRFVDTPRCYRVPVRARVECDGATREIEAVLVLHKRGLERMERAPHPEADVPGQE